MLIKLYKSAICPRCHLAKKSLLKLKAKNPGIIIKEVDVLKSPAIAWRDGIRMIPAIRINDKTLSSIYLSPQKIEDYVSSCLINTKQPLT